MNPYDKAYDLERAIRESDAYRELKGARERIESDPTTLQMLQDFRQRQWKLQARQMTGQTVPESDLSTLEKLAEVVQLNKDIRAYLEAEFRVSQLVMDVQRILSNAIDEAMLPVPDLAEEEGAN